MSRLDDVADSSETLAHFLKCCLFSVMKSAAHCSLRWTQICLMVVLAGSHTHSVSIYPEKFTNFHRLSHLARCRQSQCVWLDKKLEVIFDCELTGKLPPWGLCGSEAEINQVISLYKKCLCSPLFDWTLYCRIIPSFPVLDLDYFNQEDPWPGGPRVSC